MDPNAPPPSTSDSASLSNSFKDGVTSVTNSVSNAYGSVTDSLSSGSEYVKDSISSFGSKYASPGAEPGFLQSNTLLAKFAFLILVLIAFLFLVDLGIKVIGYFSRPKNNPYLVSGTMNASNELVISQDPNNSTTVPILRSNNQPGGIEFTWCVWIYINDINTSTVGPQYMNVFNKGNGTYDASGFASVLNGPGLYIDNINSELVVLMNTVSSLNPTETLTIQNMPLRKWFQCAIRLENTILDVYINGVIAGRMTLQDVPNQNYEDINICRNGGFNGNIADLRYFDRALSVFEINNIVIWGRNTKSSSSSGSNDATGFPYYLSNLWYNTNY